jgi:uncharacterized damage-inducible protein DinB
MKDFLQKAVIRHLQETGLYLEKLHEYENISLKEMLTQDTTKPDSLLFKIPAEGARLLGEVILHMIRSLEFYATGISKNRWEALSYNLMEITTIPEILLLYENVSREIITYLEDLSSDDLKQVIDKFNRPATKAELILEMLEHSIHHRGQLSAYLRLLSISPPSISYII